MKTCFYEIYEWNQQPRWRGKSGLHSIIDFDLIPFPFHQNKSIIPFQCFQDSVIQWQVYGEDGLCPLKQVGEWTNYFMFCSSLKGWLVFTFPVGYRPEAHLPIHSTTNFHCCSIHSCSQLFFFTAGESQPSAILIQFH